MTGLTGGEGFRSERRHIGAACVDDLHHSRGRYAHDLHGRSSIYPTAQGVANEREKPSEPSGSCLPSACSCKTLPLFKRGQIVNKFLENQQMFS